MPSLTEPALPGKSTLRGAADIAKIWNRKGHYYLGLYFLFFLWLFAFTGLLLNHGSWKFAEFWPNRKVSKFDANVRLAAGTTDLERARDAMEQLGIRGEVDWTAARPGSTAFEFRVNRPGHNFAVSVAPETGRATVEHIELNAWGVMHVLHTFTGARVGDTRNQRDWLLTEIWALTMDAVALGMVILVLSGLYLWWGLPGKRLFGALAVLAGVVVCGVLVVGMRWL